MNKLLLQSPRAVPLRQAGFSLVELMIAIVIAMVVTAGAIAVFGNMRSTFTTQDKLGQLQDNQRLALSILNTTVQSAGYYPDPTTHDVATVFAAAASANSDGTLFGAEGVIIGTGALTATSDVLNVRFSGSTRDGVMNCQGVPFAQAASAVPLTVAVSTFEVISNQLTCRVNGGTAVALIDNVSSMKVSYLVAKSATTYAYMDAPSVTAGSYWPSVIGTRITLQFIDPLKTGNQALPYTNTQIINLMNKSSST
jgi:type IV pilus assembly protein PilW